MKKWWKIVAGIYIILVVVLMLFPIIMILLRSVGIDFKQINFDVSGYLDFLIWKPLYFNAYIRSAFVAILSTIGNLVVSIPVAYIFAKVKFRGKSFIFMIYIVLMVMPFQVTLLPQYISVKRLGIYDTLYALVLPGIFSTFSVFLITQNIKTMPDDIIEAASLDTSNVMKVIYYIIIPSVRPCIVCSSILIFSEMWGQIAEPLVLIESENLYPLAVLLNSEKTFSIYEFATVVMFLFPPVMLFLLCNDDVMEGMGKYSLSD